MTDPKTEHDREHFTPVKGCEYCGLQSPTPADKAGCVCPVNEMDPDSVLTGKPCDKYIEDWHVPETCETCMHSRACHGGKA